MNLTEILCNSNPIAINILAIFSSLIESWLFYKFFLLFFDIQNSKKEKYIFIASFTVIGCISHLLPNLIVKDLLTIFAFLVLLKYILKQTLKNSFLALLFSYLLIFISQYVAQVLLTFVLKPTLEDISNVPIYYILGTLLTSVIFTGIIYAIKKLKKKNNFHIFDITPKASILVNLILGIFAMVIVSCLLTMYTDVIPFELTLIVIITLIIYFSISMYSIFRTNTLEKTQEDLENEILYNKTLSLLHDNIRGFKHDFNNIVQAIGGYVALNDMDGLRDYYKNLLNDCKLTNNLDLLNPETINNPSIYSLLTNKYFIASSKNIKMTFSIFTDLSNINFNMYELSRILGILLDNAIEAAEETEEKFVDIEFVSDNKKQLFIIRNSCKDSNISTTKIFEKGYSTKERNSGIGLWKVHKILSKNTNLDLFTTVENNIFSQQLEIFY